MMVKLKSKEYIIQEMIKSYGKDRVLVVPTKDYDFASKPKWGKNDKQRNEWLDNVVCHLYNVDRKNIIKKMRKRSTGEYSFSYIKFGINVESKKVYGLVSGKSSFHQNYASDLWFYKFEKNEKLQLQECMRNNKLEWYVEEIVILKNEDSKNAKESYANERALKERFGLFD